jgi:ATP-dependent helicase/nuclease subunit A
MKTSRPARPPADWHRIEVEVPARSRLEPWAGGQVDRAPPLASAVVESIAAAVARPQRPRADGLAAPPTWLLAPSRRIGNEWVETLVRTGRAAANLQVTTVSALAYDIVAEELIAASRVIAPPRAKLVAVESVLRAARDELESFARAATSSRRLAERVLHSIEALRAAGLTAAQVGRGLRDRAKAHDLALLMAGYEAELERLNLVDAAGELRQAIERVCAGAIPGTIERLLVPDDLELSRLERDLLDALRSAPQVELIPLVTDPPLPEQPATPIAGSASDPATAATAAWNAEIFRAAGEANEVRHVLRTCLSLGLRLDEVELVHTDAATYPALVREIVAALPAAGDSDSAPPLPVTFAEGLPLRDSKPGRGLLAWVRWRRDGHPQAGLERMLRDGLVELPKDAAEVAAEGGKGSRRPRSPSLVRTLRGVRVGRGLSRLLTRVGAAVARVREAAVDEATGGGEERDDVDDRSPEERAEAQRRRVQLHEMLDALVRRLAACEGVGGGSAAAGGATAESVLVGAREFVASLCPADSEFDGNARRKILDEIDAMLRWHDAAAAGSADDMLDWLEELPGEMVVLGEGPRPGCLHVSAIAGGGHSGRPYTFVIGLDENRFPGGGAADPVLTDGDRGQLNQAEPAAALAEAGGAAARNRECWWRLLARLRGRAWLGFTCRDTHEDGEVFPSPVLLEMFARRQGRPLAKMDELLAALPVAETFVPADPALALDESQARLATVGPDATPDRVAAAIGGHRDHLAQGLAAAAAREATAFTAHDGNVPEAGPRLDPCAGDGRVASPNSLETLGACPRRFFFRYGLGIRPLDVYDDDADRWLSPLEAGGVLHAVLERFMRGLIDRGETPRALPEQFDELLGILHEELEASASRNPPLTELARLASRGELEVAMRTFLHDEERLARETGMRPLAIEVAIGLEPAGGGTRFDRGDPVEIELEPGRSIRLRGRIDRLDGRPDPAVGTSYALWDYKTGSGFGFPASAAADPFLGGRKLQHGLYILMLRERIAGEEAGGLRGRVERFGYFFPSRSGRGRRLEWSAGQLDACAALVGRLAEIARRGVFIPTTNKQDCEFCEFVSACGDPRVVTRQAALMLEASQDLARLFAGLGTAPREARPLEVRRPDPRPLALTPHVQGSQTPPDEAVRRRIREDLGTSLLVEAAAGTGKTTCMVDRMIALVRTGTAKPQAIVAVTFTRKAAGELRRRFRERLQDEAARAESPEERGRLAEALARIDAMVIGTIHSFASRLLRDRPIEAGIDPGFRELDDPADRLLRRQAWREFVSAAPVAHARLLERLEAVGLRLGDLGGAFLGRFTTYGDVASWPTPAADPPDTAAVLAELEPFVERIARGEFSPPADRGTDELMNAIEQFARMFERADKRSIVAIMELLQELDRSPKLTQEPWPGAADDDKERSRAARDVAKRWEADWNDVRERVAVPALWQWRAHRYPVVIDALREAMRVYDRLRQDRGLLSFQDLLCRAASLLADSPEARRSFRSRYTHILVDEFQDTDPVQADMLLLLTATDPNQRQARRCVPASGSLFVVGDPKQSMYRFRRADIVTYSDVKRIIAAHGDVVALTTNFRSRTDLVEFANGVFQREFPAAATPESPAFTPSTSGRRDADTAAAAGKRWLTGVRTLRLVRSGREGDAWAEQEARLIAAFIRRAIDDGDLVPRTEKEIAAGRSFACTPGDFLIVGRERRHLGTYAAALEAVGLPVDVTGTLGADHEESLRALRVCLAAVADPDDPVAVLAMLRGPVFGFSDAELYAYRTAGGRLHGGIDEPAALEPAVRGRWAVARDAFARWRSWARRLPVAAAVERIMDDAGLLLIAALAEGEAGPRGRAVVGLLQKFLERVRNGRADVLSMHDCLDLLDDMIDDDTRAEVDPLAIDPGSTDRVRIMNLHKAKGLEAPVVFLADYQARDVGDKPEEGPWLHIDRGGGDVRGWLAVTSKAGGGQRIIAAPPDWRGLWERERGFEEAERIRLDYVAATRPAACLVVSLFEELRKGSKRDGRPDAHVAKGAWARFGPALGNAPDVPEVGDVPRATAAPPGERSAAVGSAHPLGEELAVRIAELAHPTFARIKPREVLTEPAEGLRFTGQGLGESWGRAIHRLVELAGRTGDLDVEAVAETILSAEEVSLAHVDRAVSTVRSIVGSDVWARSRAAACRFVEVPFSIQVTGESLGARVRASAKLEGPPVPTVIRGVIDLVYGDPVADRWTVVDWKTDSVTAASESQLDDHYRPQVELYAECWRHACDGPLRAAVGIPYDHEGRGGGTA